MMVDLTGRCPSYMAGSGLAISLVVWRTTRMSWVKSLAMSQCCCCWNRCVRWQCIDVTVLQTMKDG